MMYWKRKMKKYIENAEIHEIINLVHYSRMRNVEVTKKELVKITNLIFSGYSAEDAFNYVIGEMH